jgi:hypothetical protein
MMAVSDIPACLVVYRCVQSAPFWIAAGGRRGADRKRRATAVRSPSSRIFSRRPVRTSTRTIRL